MIRLCVFAVIMAMVEPVCGQTLAQRSVSASIPVALQCVRSASGGNKEITWQTDYGSSAREISRSLTYDCSVRWNGKSPTNGVLKVWFIGSPAAGGKDLVVDSQYFELDLVPAASQTKKVRSEEVDVSKANYVALGIKDRDGIKLKGCVVQLFIGDALARAYASLGQWQKLSWSTDVEAAISEVK